MGNMKYMPKYNHCRVLYLTAKEDPKSYGGEWANLINELVDTMEEDSNLKSYMELRISPIRMQQAKNVTTSHAKLVLDVLRDIAKSAPVLKEDDTKLNTFINESIIEGDLNKINLLTKGNEYAINVKFKGK